MTIMPFHPIGHPAMNPFHLFNHRLNLQNKVANLSNDPDSRTNPAVHSHLNNTRVELVYIEQQYAEAKRRRPNDIRRLELAYEGTPEALAELATLPEASHTTRYKRPATAPTTTALAQLQAIYYYDATTGTVTRRSDGKRTAPLAQSIMVNGQRVPMHRVIAALTKTPLKEGERLRSRCPDTPEQWAARHVYIHAPHGNELV